MLSNMIVRNFNSDLIPDLIVVFSGHLTDIFNLSALPEQNIQLLLFTSSSHHYFSFFTFPITKIVLFSSVMLNSFSME